MSTLEPILCRDVVELVSDYLGDGLSPERRIVLEQHLLVCPPCSTHVDQMRATVTLVKSLRTESEAEQGALAIFQKWKAAK